MVRIRDWQQEAQLGKRAVATTGVITNIESNNHHAYDYEYSVAGVTYKGVAGLASDSLGVGQRVYVSYIPDAPQTSTLTRFGELGSRPVPLLFCTCVVLTIYFRLRKFLTGPENPYDR